MRWILMFAFMLMIAPAYAESDVSVEDSLIETVRKSEEAAKPAATTTPAQLKAKIKEAVKKRTKDKSEATGVTGTKPKPKKAAAAAPKSANALPDMMINRDVSYGDDPAQLMDIYAPYGSGSAPVIMILQSANWLKDEKETPVASSTKIQHWTRKGYVVVALRTRMLPDVADVALQAEDIPRAVFYLKDNLKRLGGDPDRIVVMAYGAGAHLLMLAASDPVVNRGVMWLANIALDSPIYDTTSMMRGRPTANDKLVFGDDPDNWVRLSPYSRQKGPVVPSLMICPKDVRDGCMHAEKYQTKSQRSGNIVTVMPVEKDHAQINTDVGAPGAYTDAIDAFLKPLVDE